MPSVLENASSDYLPSNGFTQGSEASLKKLAKVVVASPHEDEQAILQSFPSLQYYANNSLLGSKYVSPVLEDNLERACPIMLVSRSFDPPPHCPLVCVYFYHPKLRVHSYRRFLSL